MKLRNKKTGKIIKLDIHCIAGKVYESLAELNEEWEDVPEEPKDIWCITMYGGITRIKDDEEPIDDLIEIGNYFSSKEDAYDAWDKLKAWKRLKDKGFSFNGGDDACISYEVDIENWTMQDLTDFKTLFGGEE